MRSDLGIPGAAIQFKKSLSRPQAKMEDGLDYQGTFYGAIGVDPRSTSPFEFTLITPGRYRILVDPEGDTATMHQCAV